MWRAWPSRQKSWTPVSRNGSFRQHRDPVIGLLAVDRLVDIAQLAEGLRREQAVLHLGLLQAQHVGLLVPQEAGDQGQPEAHRIDVPGGDFQLLHPFYAATAQRCCHIRNLYC